MNSYTDLVGSNKCRTTTQIYEQATSPNGNLVDKDVISQQEKAEKIRLAKVKSEEFLAHNHWAKDLYTQKVFKELKDKRDEFNTQALQLANSFHQHNNHQQIIYLLNQVNSINNILDTYGRTNK